MLSSSNSERGKFDAALSPPPCRHPNAGNSTRASLGPAAPERLSTAPGRWPRCRGHDGFPPLAAHGGRAGVAAFARRRRRRARRGHGATRSSGGSAARSAASGNDDRTSRRFHAQTTSTGSRRTTTSAPSTAAMNAAANARSSARQCPSPACKSNLQLDFNVSVFECVDTSTSAVLREIDESNRSVQKSAESTSI